MMSLPRIPEHRRHLLWLLFWPCYILRYLLIENWNPAESYHVIWCPLDDAIPFCEGFLVFYVRWYLLIAFMHVYLLLFDVDAFLRYSRFWVIATGISTVIFLLYPSCQTLRPEVFPRDNVLTRIVGFLYSVDTSTNVFPSEHVIGAVAVASAAVHTERLRSPGKLALIGSLCLLSAVATVFLKQHSVLDAVAALPVCLIAYLLCWRRKCAKKSAP